MGKGKTKKHESFAVDSSVEIEMKDFEPDHGTPLYHNYLIGLAHENASDNAETSPVVAEANYAMQTDDDLVKLVGTLAAIKSNTETIEKLLKNHAAGLSGHTNDSMYDLVAKNANDNIKINNTADPQLPLETWAKQRRDMSHVIFPFLATFTREELIALAVKQGTPPEAVHASPSGLMSLINYINPAYNGSQHKEAILAKWVESDVDSSLEAVSGDAGGNGKIITLTGKKSKAVGLCGRCHKPVVKNTQGADGLPYHKSCWLIISKKGITTENDNTLISEAAPGPTTPDGNPGDETFNTLEQTPTASLPAFPLESLEGVVTQFEFPPPLESYLTNLNQGQPRVTWQDQEIKYYMQLVISKASSGAAIANIINTVNHLQQLQPGETVPTEWRQSVVTAFHHAISPHNLASRAAEYQTVKEYLENSETTAIPPLVKEHGNDKIKFSTVLGTPPGFDGYTQLGIPPWARAMQRTVNSVEQLENYITSGTVNETNSLLENYTTAGGRDIRFTPETSAETITNWYNAMVDLKKHYHKVPESSVNLPKLMTNISGEHITEMWTMSDPPLSVMREVASSVNIGVTTEDAKMMTRAQLKKILELNAGHEWNSEGPVYTKKVVTQNKIKQAKKLAAHTACTKCSKGSANPVFSNGAPYHAGCAPTGHPANSMNTPLISSNVGPNTAASDTLKNLLKEQAATDRATKKVNEHLESVPSPSVVAQSYSTVLPDVKKLNLMGLIAARMETRTAVPVTLTATEMEKRVATLKLAPNMHLGGVHSKTYFTDEEGGTWMGKSYPSDSNSAARVEAEVAASRVASLAGLNNVPVYAQKVNGTLYALQPVVKNVGNMKHVPVEQYTQAEVSQTLEAAIPAWLIGDHDGHGGQLLRTGNHKGVVQIDMGQAFKYFPNDELSTNYHPNETYGETEPAWQTILKRGHGNGLAEGVVVDTSVLAARVAAVEKIPSHVYEDALRPTAEAGVNGNAKWVQTCKEYAAGRLGKPAHSVTDSETVAEFLRLAVERKTTLRATFGQMLIENGYTDAKASFLL
jgi:cytochrome c553